MPCSVLDVSQGSEGSAERFAYRPPAADPRINRRFAHVQASGLTNNLVELICERSGGPCVYRGRDMAAAHEGMNIRDEEFDALVDDLMRSLDSFGVPPRERGEALAKLEQMRNAIVGH